MEQQQGDWSRRERIQGNTPIGFAGLRAAAFMSVLLTAGLGHAQVIPGLPIPPPRPTLPDTRQDSPPVLPQQEAPSQLVREFYQQLKNPTMSKAAALQQAQLKISSEPNHDHPSYWAPFLLINNWL